jgi:hypothetical protein
MVGAKTATSAPRASSQASVSGEMYALVRLTAVWITDEINKAAMIIDKSSGERIAMLRSARVEN